MGGRTVSHWLCRLAVAGLLGLFVAGAAQPADASKPRDPAIYLSSAGLTPDSQAVIVRLDVNCSEPQTVLDARVSVAQPQASGEAPFSPRCIERDIVEVTVPSSGGVFQTGEAQVSAVIVFGQGRTKEARDFEVMRVAPIVTVALADVGRLEDGGQATVIDVTVACPVGSTGQQSPVFLYPSQAFYLPTCDGSSHTFSVRLESSRGWLPGSHTVTAFAHVEEGGDRFTGWDRRTVLITES